MSRTTFVRGLALAMLASSAARADDATTSRADALFREARDAMRRGDAESACPKFRESQSLDPSPVTLLNLGLCEEARGDFVAAWTAAIAAQGALPKGDPREPIAKDLVSRAEKRVARVRFDMPTDRDVAVTVDGKPVDRSRPLGVAPGQHVVAFSDNGGTRSITASLAAGEERAISLPVEREPAHAPAPANDAVPARSTPLTGYLLLGTGVVVGAGAVALYVASSGAIASCRLGAADYDACKSSQADVVDRKSNERTAAALLGVAAIVVAGAGGYLILSADRDGSSTALGLQPTATGFVMAWRGTLR